MIGINFNFPHITFTSPGQVVFSVFNWQIRWYGIFIALSFLACYFIGETLVKKANLSLEHFNNLVILVLIFSILFARLYFVALNREYFYLHLDEIPKIWLGGQSIHGGILGAALALLLYSTVKKISFYKYADIATIVAPLGQSIGRWGNFFNNEAFGKPVENWIFRLYIPPENRPSDFLVNNYFHPTFFYESFLDFIIFVFLYKKFSVWKEKPGKIFWVYLFSYGVIRFVLEFLRVDSVYFANISVAHVASIFLIMLSTLMLYFQNKSFPLKNKV